MNFGLFEQNERLTLGSQLERQPDECICAISRKSSRHRTVAKVQHDDRLGLFICDQSKVFQSRDDIRKKRRDLTERPFFNRCGVRAQQGIAMTGVGGTMTVVGIMDVAATLTFVVSWSQYLLTLLIGGGAVITLPLLLFSFAGSGDNAIAAALCLVFVAPALILLVFTARYLGGEPGAMEGFGKM